ncbi:MAG: hypothetical protein P1U88_22575 [Thalassobaculaceae bacterium]|nr:hypothetical protein [Thalassobaculaceae bacterium]
MDKVLIILSLFGCADSGTQCELLDTAGQVYATHGVCERRIDAALATGQDAAYPTIIAYCGTPAETAQVVDTLTPTESPAAAVAANLDAADPSS